MEGVGVRDFGEDSELVLTLRPGGGMRPLEVVAGSGGCSVFPRLLTWPSIILTDRSTRNGIWLRVERGNCCCWFHCWFTVFRGQSEDSPLVSKLPLLNFEFGRVTGQRECLRWKPTARCLCVVGGAPSVMSRLRKFCNTQGK